MNRFGTILLAFVSIQSYACEIPLGRYLVVTESHWGIELELKENNAFQVTHGAYLAGKPESLETKTYSGSWSCVGKKAKFNYEIESIEAEYIKPASYPLGIYQKSEAIVFSGNHKQKSLLSGYVFWPEKPRKE